MHAHPFEALVLPMLPDRPRAQAMTSILDKGMGRNESADLVEVAGEWIDVVKLGWGTARICPEPVLRGKIKTYQAAGIAVATGGTFLEIAHAQGRIEEFIDGVKRLGVDIVEVSNGVHPMSEGEKLGLIHRIRRAGLRVWSEVGKKDAEADARLTVEDRIDAIRLELDAGAEKVILEARETGTIGIFDRDGRPMVDLLNAIVQRVGIERIVFEAPQKSQQVWLIRQFGAGVNLGNIPAPEVIALATLRLGLRGDTFADMHLPKVNVHTAVGLTGALEARKRGGVVVLIDALRSCATIIAALAHGMSAVKPVATGADCVGDVTAGERGGHKLPNVRHNNSPTEIIRHNYLGRTLVLTTTNGVECLLAASGPDTTILVGTTLNRTAVAREAQRLARERNCPITLLISGRHNRDAIEDRLAAGEIFNAMQGARLNGPAFANGANLESAFFLSESGRNLVKLGAAEDIRFCARRDVYDVTPVWRDGVIEPLQPVTRPAPPLVIDSEPRTDGSGAPPLPELMV
jgi:phosphosulfolactate synthase (CoM biosynthesis protein A)/phosphosulfolactate phosphohydrolase-like enzyme